MRHLYITTTTNLFYCDKLGPGDFQESLFLSQTISSCKQIVVIFTRIKSDLCQWCFRIIPPSPLFLLQEKLFVDVVKIQLFLITSTVSSKLLIRLSFNLNIQNLTLPCFSSCSPSITRPQVSKFPSPQAYVNA